MCGTSRDPVLTSDLNCRLLFHENSESRCTPLMANCWPKKQSSSGAADNSGTFLLRSDVLWRNRTDSTFNLSCHFRRELTVLRIWYIYSVHLQYWAIVRLLFRLKTRKVQHLLWICNQFNTNIWITFCDFRLVPSTLTTASHEIIVHIKIKNWNIENGPHVHSK